MSKRLNFTNIRSVCFLVSALSLLCSPTLAGAQTRLQVEIGSGSDDLRGGNRAFIDLVHVDGRTEITEQVLSTGLGSRRTVTTLVTFPETIDTSLIRSIRIRHDGNPRSGHPFDEYDKWDLRTLRVTRVSGSSSQILYDSARDSQAGNFVRQFTDRLRQIDLPIRILGSEPDFIITGITGSPRGLSVRVSNVGSGSGTLTRVSCSSFGRAITRDTSTRLRVGERTTVSVGFSPSGTVTCAPSGVDSSGNPEAVTANNNFSQRFP